MNKKWFLFVASVAGFCFGLNRFGSYLDSVHEATPEEKAIKTSQFRPVEEKDLAKQRLEKQKKIGPVSKTFEANWEDFKKQFGSELKPEFSEDGKLIAIQGSRKAAGQTHSDFNSKDSKQVLSRAEEILSASQDLLGVKSDWPLKNVSVKTGPMSAQAYFVQSYQGLRVFPVGSVKLDLGKQGEVLALNSDYASDLKIVNQDKLDALSATHKAVEAFGDSTQSQKSKGVLVQDASKAIWAVDKDSGKYAFRVIVSGREIFVDSETGEILSNRDRRVH